MFGGPSPRRRTGRQDPPRELERSTNQRGVGRPSVQAGIAAVRYAIYVSSKGQLFKRLTSVSRRDGRRARRTVSRGGIRSTQAGARDLSGNTLISTMNNGGLGRRIRITFDGGSSCSAEVLSGKRAQARIGEASPLGKWSNSSRSPWSRFMPLQDGNGFAN